MLFYQPRSSQTLFQHALEKQQRFEFSVGMICPTLSPSPGDIRQSLETFVALIAGSRGVEY